MDGAERASPSPPKRGSSRAGSPGPRAPAHGAPQSLCRSPAGPGTATGSGLLRPPPRKACRKPRGQSIAASTCTCNPKRQKCLRDPSPGEVTPLPSPSTATLLSPPPQGSPGRWGLTARWRRRCPAGAGAGSSAASRLPSPSLPGAPHRWPGCC